MLKQKSRQAGIPLAGFSDESSIRRGSIRRDQRAVPVEAIIQAGLHSMLLVAEGAERDKRDRGGEPAAVEVIKLVLDLGRPVLGEHVFQASADSEAIAMVAIEREADRNAGGRQGFAVVGVGITSLGVQQRRPPGVTDAPRYGGNRALVVGESE